jgi:hypothetical protein
MCHLARRERSVDLAEPAQGAGQAVVGLRSRNIGDRFLEKRSAVLESAVINGSPTDVKRPGA